MKIERISLYTAELRYAGKAYAFSGGRTYETFTSSVLVLETDDGLQGVGEVCPCGPSYMPAFAEGVPACLDALAPAVLGQDPRGTSAIHQRMDAALNGHAYVKHAVDTACWDLYGKATDEPLYRLLGGALNESLALHRVVPLAEPEVMRQTMRDLRQVGYHSYQIKLGHDIASDAAMLRTLAEDFEPGEILVGDANGAWTRDEVVRFSRAVADLDIYLEQPCRSYQECRALHGRIAHPLKLDESLATTQDLLQALRDDVIDAAAIKLSRVGGLTPGRVMRDLCVAGGLPVTFEDAWGSGIATAAFAHLAMSTPEHCVLNTTDLHNYNTTQLADGAPEVRGGRLYLSERPGLGVTPDFDALGQPAREWTAQG